MSKAYWKETIEKAPRDLTALNNIIEEAAFDEELTTEEYTELYELALGRI